MSDGTSIQIWDGDTPLFRAGDRLDSTCPATIVVRVTRTSLTYRPWRWYDGPRLWFRGLLDRWRSRRRAPSTTGEATE